MIHPYFSISQDIRRTIDETKSKEQETKERKSTVVNEAEDTRYRKPIRQNI